MALDEHDVLSELMRDSLDHCVKCTICETFCPVSNVTPLFPGPKYVGPQADPHASGAALDQGGRELSLGGHQLGLHLLGLVDHAGGGGVLAQHHLRRDERPERAPFRILGMRPDDVGVLLRGDFGNRHAKTFLPKWFGSVPYHAAARTGYQGEE